MKCFLLLSLCIGFYAQAASSQSIEKKFPRSFKVEISNPLNSIRESVIIVLSPEELKQVKDFNPKAFVVMDGPAEIPSQYNEGEGSKGVVFVIEKFKAGELKEIVVRFHPSAVLPRNYKKLTQAELSYKRGGEWKNREYIGGAFKNTEYLRVPPEHKDHSWFIRYEGPGWESDQVGYRFYLDQRNATDVFGKKTPAPILQKVGLEDFEAYHHMQPWGMDVMKVGKSLGLGSVGAIHNGAVLRVEKTDSVTCRITENGNVYSSILTKYHGWEVGRKKHDVQSLISIHAGTRLTRQSLITTNSIDSLCTGVVKDKNATLFKSSGGQGKWGYLATYGKQSLNNDELGLVVFFNPAEASGFTEDEFSNIVVLKSNDGKVEYYFAGAWVLEQNGIKNQAQFIDYINKVAGELARPVSVNVQAQ
jgi:hypothetical protein